MGGVSHELFELSMPFVSLPIFSLNDHHDVLEEILQQHFHSYMTRYADLTHDYSVQFNYLNSHHNEYSHESFNGNLGTFNDGDNSESNNEFVDLLNNPSCYQTLDFAATDPSIVSNVDFINNSEVSVFAQSNFI